MPTTGLNLTHKPEVGGEQYFDFFISLQNTLLILHYN